MDSNLEEKKIDIPQRPDESVIIRCNENGEENPLDQLHYEYPHLSEEGPRIIKSLHRRSDKNLHEHNSNCQCSSSSTSEEEGQPPPKKIGRERLRISFSFSSNSSISACALTSDSDLTDNEEMTKGLPSHVVLTNDTESEILINPVRIFPSDTSVDYDSDDLYRNELEVASNDEINDNPIEDCNSSSGVDAYLESRLELPSVIEEGEEVEKNFGDADSESDGNKGEPAMSDDSELSDRDKWQCTQCKSKTSPHLSLCNRCFRIRRNWLPSRPKSRKTKTRTKSGPNTENPIVLQMGSLPKSLSSQDTDALEDLSQSTKIESQIEKSPTMNSPEQNIGPEDKEKIPNSICQYCFIREKNAAFVHNKIAHQVCCYFCADKILKKTGQCPICRERILRVVKIIVS